jgi:hypothetical protein
MNSSTYYRRITGRGAVTNALWKVSVRPLPLIVTLFTYLNAGDNVSLSHHTLIFDQFVINSFIRACLI